MDKGQLEFIIRLFKYYKHLGDEAIERCDDKQLNEQANVESNSMKMIVKHISGNMLSRWTDFLNSDGEKTWRNRDSEFENDTWTKAQIRDYWEKGWSVFLETLNSLTPDDLSKTVYIRNEAHTVPEAIYRQLGHYPYHD